ncbi:Uncharacterised protein [Serratia plymuthica]|nr:Uncharacterised protein [Serratia plymuthica]
MDLQAYSVAVRLTATDDLSRVLKAASQDVMALHDRLWKITKDLKSITSYANSAGEALRRMATAADSPLSTASSRANEFAAGMKNAAGHARDAANAMNDLQRSNSFSPRNLPGNGYSTALVGFAGAAFGSSGAGGGRGFGGGGNGLQMLPSPSSAGWNGYNPTNGWNNSTPPGGWGNGGGNGGGSGNGEFGGNRGMSMRDAGMTNLATGYFGFEFLNNIAKKGTEYEREVARLRQMGLSTAQVTEAQNFVASHKIVNTSLLDRMRIFTDAQGAFRESGLPGKQALEAAEVMTPILAKYEVATKALSGGSAAAASGNMRNLNKIVEMMGGLGDTNRAQAITDAVFKASQSSGRLVDERALKLFVAHGGAATNLQNIRTIMGGLEPIIAEVGGDVAANGMLTAYNRMSGNMSLKPKNLLREMKRLGVADGSGSEQTRDLTNLQVTDALGYTQKMMQIYKEHGITSRVDIERENAILFGRSGARIYNRLMSQMKTLELSEQSYDSQRGTDSTISDPNSRVIMAREALSKSFENLQLVLARKGGVLEKFTNGINSLSNGIDKITLSMEAHPNIAKFASNGVMIVTALAGVSGGIWVLKHAFDAIRIPLSFLVGSEGFPLLSKAIGGMPNVVALAAAAIGTALSVEIYNRVNAAINGQRYDQIATQGQEMTELDRLAKRNWQLNHPGQPYPGRQIGSLPDRAPIPGMSPGSSFTAPIPGKTDRPIVLNVHSILDGKKVGEGTMKYWLKELTKQPSSTSGFDSTMLMLSPGAPSNQFPR